MRTRSTSHLLLRRAAVAASAITLVVVAAGVAALGASAHADAPQHSNLSGRSNWYRGPVSAPTTPPSDDPVDVIEVASVNSFHDLKPREVLGDARKIASIEAVDLIGWQEGERYEKTYRKLSDLGFQTVFWERGGNEVPISFRSSVFELTDPTSQAYSWKMHSGGSGPYPFPSRYVTSLVLTHKASGQDLTFINTHLNQRIDAFNEGHPGHPTDTDNWTKAKTHLEKLHDIWADVSTRWAIGVGDFNVDYKADAAQRTGAFPQERLGDVAISSYRVLGTTGVKPTQDDQRRWIDYAWMSKALRDAGYLEFVDHRSIGLRSDHRALIARIALY